MLHTIHIVGLGAGDIQQLSLGAYACLEKGQNIYLRTRQHPVVKELEKKGISFESFDDIYEDNREFSDIYDEIVIRLLELSQIDEVVYGVPGHPMIAECTTQKLLEKQRAGQAHLKIYSAPSFLDEMFTSLQFDPVEGFTLIDGTAFEAEDIQLHKHMIFTQVYDARVASDIKLTLLEVLPADYSVTLLSHAGMEEEISQTIPLCEMDHGLGIDNLRSIYVPPVKDRLLPRNDFTTLVRIIEQLRGPNGCPWDRRQTHESLMKYLIEESEELFEAINQQNEFQVEEELGDVLLQVILHAQIATEKGQFTIFDVIRTLNEKMIHRHPHVFGDRKASTEEDVMKIWQEMKEKE